jgi:hypothetical protein
MSKLLKKKSQKPTKGKEAASKDNETDIQRKCKCGNPLPSDYKHRSCDYCRNRHAEIIHTAVTGITAAGVVALPVMKKYGPKIAKSVAKIILKK